MRDRRFSNLPVSPHLLVDCASHPPPLQLCLGRCRAGQAALLELGSAKAKSGLTEELEEGLEGRQREDVLARQFPLAQPPPSFLHSPEGVTGRKGWKEGKGKKGGRGKKSGSSSEEAGRPELPVGCGHGSRPWRGGGWPSYFLPHLTPRCLQGLGQRGEARKRPWEARAVLKEQSSGVEGLRPSLTSATYCATLGESHNP